MVERNKAKILSPVILETRVVRGSGGGPDKTIFNSPRYLWSAGYRTVCAYMHPPNDPGFEQLRRKAREANAPLVSIHDRGAWDWRVVTQYLAICRRERVSIWHGHDYKSNVLGLLVRQFWPMHLVTTVHGWVKHTRRTPLYYRIDRLCLPRYESVICVSDDLRERALECGVPQDRCLLIENGIDTVEFSRQASIAAAKQREGLQDRFTIGAVGRLSAEKGFDLLIRAAHELILRGLDIQVIIAGDGEAESELMHLIHELQLQDRVRLLGYRSDVRGLYEAMDLFVLSSLREGLPNVVLEAMAMEAPVLATRVAGIPRLVQDGDNGMLIDSGSVEQLAESIGKLFKDATLRARLAAGGRQTVVNHFNFATRMTKIQAIYDRLLSRPANQSPKSAHLFPMSHE